MKKIQPKTHPCPDCDGSGKRSGIIINPINRGCPTCHGRGTVDNLWGIIDFGFGPGKDGK